MTNLSSKIYYKLSETIINNLLADQTKNQKPFDGNYVVLKTLISLKEGYGFNQKSFVWAPCVDIVWREGSENRCTDIDIAAIQDGKLILGEAKVDADDFKKKGAKENLMWIAKNLLPDKLLLAYDVGNIDSTVIDLKQRLSDFPCEIITYKTTKPWYHIPGLYGLG
ncbi:MAG: hypothetical protein WDN26_06950 [Chitinophagaceae bacterium]